MKFFETTVAVAVAASLSHFTLRLPPPPPPTNIHYYTPSTSEVMRESSVAFLRPGGNDTPMDSNRCLRTWPPFLDFALQRRSEDNSDRRHGYHSAL